MKFKYGKLYAKWTDATGKRLHKAFVPKRAALKHQEKRREAVPRLRSFV